MTAMTIFEYENRVSSTFSSLKILEKNSFGSLRRTEGLSCRETGWKSDSEALQPPVAIAKVTKGKTRPTTETFLSDLAAPCASNTHHKATP